MAQAGGRGQQIALPYLHEMEHHFGCSFAHVKVYVDPDKTAALNAKAYTFGNEITFATPAPDRALVMHELTHVVQQTMGRSGSVRDDEAEAETVQAGAKPAAVLPSAARQPDPALRKDELEPASGELLTAAKIKSAIAFNHQHWNGIHRTEILARLRAAPSSDAFEEPDVIRVAALQKEQGVAAEGIDGKIGPSTMAFLLRTGLTLSVSPNKIRPEQVRLIFYPGEFEDLDAWQAARNSVGKQGQEDEHRAVSAKAPPGHGVIYVEFNGNIVDRMEARGGPPFSMKDGPKHTSDPSQAGTYTLGVGKSVVTSSWAHSQIAWGAPLQAVDGEIQFKNPGEAWKWATGPKRQIKGEIARHYFHEDKNPAKPVAKEWRHNDFGATGFRVEGSPGLFIHTTPQTEDQLTKLGPELALDHSHGCLHVQPAKRNELMKEGYLQKGVTLVIKKYTEWLDPGAKNRK